MKLLALCDSPTVSTGFATVATNLFRQWQAAGVTIEVWAIGFDGFGYDRSPWKLYPAQEGGTIPWYDSRKLMQFLEKLQKGDYTHVFLLQDLFLLSRSGFPSALKTICQQKGIRSLLYFPVDAPWMPPAWTEILDAVDVAVAYTDFGKAVAEKALGESRKQKAEMEQAGPEAGAPQSAIRNPQSPIIHVLPHGVDTAIFRPLAGDREAARAKLWTKGDGTPWVKPGDWLMLNVNVNQRRKDITRSLEILALLRVQGVPAKLVLHMRRVSDAGVDIEAIAAQFGLTAGEEYVHHDQYFTAAAHRSSLTQEQVVQLYNAADLTLTTTLGEGWGLSITEALACGCPVAMPDHTSCEEIYDNTFCLDSTNDREWSKCQMVPMRAYDRAPALDLDNSLVRPRVTLELAVKALAEYHRSNKWTKRIPMPRAVRDWLSWPRAAREMLKLMKN